MGIQPQIDADYAGKKPRHHSSACPLYESCAGRLFSVLVNAYLFFAVTDPKGIVFAPSTTKSCATSFFSLWLSAFVSKLFHTAFEVVVAACCLYAIFLVLQAF